MNFMRSDRPFLDDDFLRIMGGLEVLLAFPLLSVVVCVIF